MTDRPTSVLLVEPAPGASGTGALDGDHGLSVERRGELAGALQRLSAGGIDVVLLDLHLPDCDGIETFERMHAFAPGVPILVMTEEGEDWLGATAIEGGAQDHWARGERGTADVARAVSYAVERHERLARVRRLSLIDELTGLYNGRGFADLGERLLRLIDRSEQGASVFFIDLDRFRTINDGLGHHVGDRALVQTANVLRSTFRRSDVLARLRADQFAAFATDAVGSAVELVVDRVRQEFRRSNESTREMFRLSASIGMARLGGEERPSIGDLLGRARDSALEEKTARRREVLG